MPGRIAPNTKTHELAGGLDLMATFAALAGVKLPENDRAGQPTIFDSYDMSPIIFGTGKSARTTWFYFTENELSPGAIRYNNYKFAFNIRGDDGASTGGLAVDTNLGWKGAEKYVATVPQVFDLWQDPQERYDIFMNNFTERTWMGVVMGEELKKVMASFVKYPPRKVQSYGYTGPITLSNYEKYQFIRDSLAKEGISVPMPTGN
jgi:arylsulfatase A-like enzyme